MTREEFLAQYRAANWPKIKASLNYVVEGDAIYASSWLASEGGLYTGKIYAPWSTNITQEEADLDELANEALSTVCEENGGFLDWIDGSAFFMQHVADLDDVVLFDGNEFSYQGEPIAYSEEGLETWEEANPGIKVWDLTGDPRPY